MREKSISLLPLLPPFLFLVWRDDKSHYFSVMDVSPAPHPSLANRTGDTFSLLFPVLLKNPDILITVTDAAIFSLLIIGAHLVLPITHLLFTTKNTNGLVLNVSTELQTFIVVLTTSNRYQESKSKSSYNACHTERSSITRRNFT